jgi:hypothetical protein
MKNEDILEAILQQTAFLKKIDQRLAQIDEKLSLSLLKDDLNAHFPKSQKLRNSWGNLTEAIENIRIVQGKESDITQTEIENVSLQIHQEIELVNKFWGEDIIKENPLEGLEIPDDPVERKNLYLEIGFYEYSGISEHPNFKSPRNFKEFIEKLILLGGDSNTGRRAEELKTDIYHAIRSGKLQRISEIDKFLKLQKGQSSRSASMDKETFRQVLLAIRHAGKI